jgi:hypothetical protein
MSGYRKKSPAADLHAARLFVKAESENNRASGLESFLDQTFNGCAILGFSVGATAGEK